MNLAGKYLWNKLLRPMGLYQGIEELGHMVIALIRVNEDSSSPHPLQHLLPNVPLIFAILTGVGWNFSFFFLMCTILIAMDDEQIESYFLAAFISSFENSSIALTLQQKISLWNRRPLQEIITTQDTKTKWSWAN